MAGSFDLSRFNWSSFDLLVIDESHNFRNHTGQRYQRLVDEIIDQGARTKVLMLSATPVNTSLLDLRHQIYLMTARRVDAFRESLGLSNISTLLTTAQREFRRWEKEQAGQPRRDKSRLLEKLGADFLRLLDAVSIARSRRQIEQFYAQEMERIGQFPNHEKPDNRYPPTDLRGQLSYKELADRIGQFELSIYRPTDYLIDEDRRRELADEREQRNFNQQDREHWLIAMINFLKRLESSPHSLTLTLERTVGKIDTLIERIERYIAGQPTGRWPMSCRIEDDEEFFVNRARHPYHLRQLDLDKWRHAPGPRDAGFSQRAGGRHHSGPGRKAPGAGNTGESPAADHGSGWQDQPQDPRVHLVQGHRGVSLRELGRANSLDLNVAMVSGDATRASLGANNFNAILTRFAPRARNRPASDDPTRSIC